MSATRWQRRAAMMAVLLAFGPPAAAQYGAPRVADPATGEKYHFEFAANFWKPGPEISISSEELGIPGTVIDFIDDLGIDSEQFTEFKITLRPFRKHKFRADYLPVKYTAGTVLERTIVFNGIAYTIGLPVDTELTWKTWNLFYEYDFIYRDRGFAGFLLGAKYTDVEARLTSPVSAEFARARGPIPAIGGIGRVYVMPNIAITGQVTLFDMPDDAFDDFNGDMYDIDIYGTVNFTNNVGAQVGYRSVDVEYFVDLDQGALNVDGFYFGGVVRF